MPTGSSFLAQQKHHLFQPNCLPQLHSSHMLMAPSFDSKCSISIAKIVLFLLCLLIESCVPKVILDRQQLPNGFREEMLISHSHRFVDSALITIPLYCIIFPSAGTGRVGKRGNWPNKFHLAFPWPPATSWPRSGPDGTSSSTTASSRP